MKSSEYEEKTEMLDIVSEDDVVEQKEEVISKKVEDNVKKEYFEVEIKKSYQETRSDSHFDGKLLDLFGWKMLKNTLTLMTAGVAGPWGECLALNYEISHTVLDGKRLKFAGDGGSLYVERFKWILFSIITLGIYTLWIPAKKLKWIVSNIYFEEDGYKREESYFDGNTFQLVGINIMCAFLNIVSLFLLYPFTQCIKLRWIAKHCVISRKKVVFEGSALGLYGKYLLWLFLTVITFGIYGLWLNLKLISWKVSKSRIRLVSDVDKKDTSIFVMIAVFVVAFIIALVVLFSNPIDFGGFGPQSAITDNDEMECYNGICCDDYGYCIDENEYRYQTGGVVSGYWD